MKHKEFMAALDESAIMEAIGRAERNCSGEIRVHVEPRVIGGNLRGYAERTFERLGMTRTALRNGVLLFICSEQQQFVILGDRGIHEKVGQEFWDRSADALSTRFKERRFTEGIVAAINEIGSLLAAHFPWQSGDVDELPNEISTGGDRND